ncbi:MAG: NAD(P)-binding domain-containing protein [Pseudomonadota bacterium]|nr:NAD(P)-binding domain-containing protein [Pseudomonadota bacterium]
MTAIGFVGFGEVASRFGEALAQGGAQVLAYDVLLDRADGGQVLAGRVRGTAPEFVPLPQLLQKADIVLSTVTTDVALAAARNCAPHLRRGQAFVDLNATSPALKREVAAVVAPTGADFVEGAILPAVGVMGAKSQVLVCGAQAARIAQVLNAAGLNFSPYGEEIGRASSFKMMRSIFSKGLEALLVECLLAGRRVGVGDDLWREIVATLDATSFEEVGGNWVRTHGTAHARRYHEMVQVEQLLRDLGIDAPMTKATVALFERSTRVGLRDAFPAAPKAHADVIAALEQRLAANPKP